MSGFLTQIKLERNEYITKWLAWIFISMMIIAGVGFRFVGLKFLSLDMRHFLIGWYNQLATKGFNALREPFSNYTPPYLYLLYFATKTSSFLPKVTAIKLISICFDFLNAFLSYKILKIRFPEGVVALIGGSAFLLLPTVLLNSAFWGQCDAIYSFFALASVYFLMKAQPLPAMIFLGIAFSFKAQAMFLAPLVFLLVLRKKIPWLYIGIISAMYVLMMVPAALTGRPLLSLLKIYMGQEEKYSALSSHAPNWYLFFPKSFNDKTTVLLGLVITVIVVLAWTAVYAWKFKTFTPEVILLCVMMSVAFMPFFLPKMHERYFYLADVTSFLMAFYFPQGWLLALGYQLTSGLAYSIFLSESFMRLKHPVIGNILFSALFVNIALLGFMFSNRWKSTEHITEVAT